MFNPIPLNILRFRAKTMPKIKGKWQPLKGNRVNINKKKSWTVWKIKIWMLDRLEEMIPHNSTLEYKSTLRSLKSLWWVGGVVESEYSVSSISER